MLTTQVDRIETGVRSVMRRVESDQEGFIKLIQAAMTAQVREATIALETQQGRVIDGAEKAMCDAELGVTRLLETITQRTQIQLEVRDPRWNDWSTRSRSKPRPGLMQWRLDLDQIKTQVGRDTGRMITKAVDDLDKSLSLLESGAISITDDARKDIENFARIIVGMGPQSTLQRGFAIVRDDEDKPLTSREAAMNHALFQVQFRDGRVAVKNMDRSGGDEQ